MTIDQNQKIIFCINGQTHTDLTKPNLLDHIWSILIEYIML